MRTYEKTSLIKCNIEDLFTFHLDLNNLKLITPKDTSVTLLSDLVTPKEGDVLKFKSVKNFIPMRWDVLIQKVQKPNLLLDVALKSPFNAWEHSHIFEDNQDGTCTLKDVVRYKLPFGFIGNFFDFFMRWELEKMFTYRHEVTTEFLQKASQDD